VASDVPRFVADLAAALKRQLAQERATESRRILADRLLPHSWSEVFLRYERVYDEIVRGGVTAGSRAGGVPEKVIHGGAQ
jgi:hypothetical protein